MLNESVFVCLCAKRRDKIQLNTTCSRFCFQASSHIPWYPYIEIYVEKEIHYWKNRIKVREKKNWQNLHMRHTYLGSVGRRRKKRICDPTDLKEGFKLELWMHFKCATYEYDYHRYSSTNLLFSFYFETSSLPFAFFHLYLCVVQILKKHAHSVLP